MAEAARPAADERLTREGPLTALVKRPDMGAVIGAVAVFLLFAWTARNVSWISDLGIYSQWSDQAAQYGVVAVPVALLMIAASIEGRSTILNADPIRRAHPRFVENLRSLGADVAWEGAEA